MASRFSRAGLIGRIFYAGAALALLLALGALALIFAYLTVTPTSTLMLAREIAGQPVERVYVPLSRVSPAVIASVIASEDAHFCRHHGVDWGALREVMNAAGPDGPARGASTIAMQTAKNLFLWPWRSAIRKAFEIPLALAIDFIWPKRRVLEVYLNIAEWGEGRFGIEAAARRAFNTGADRLDAQQAALLIAALPNPHVRDPGKPTRAMIRRAAAITARARQVNVSCVREGARD